VVVCDRDNGSVPREKASFYIIDARPSFRLGIFMEFSTYSQPKVL